MQTTICIDLHIHTHNILTKEHTHKCIYTHKHTNRGVSKADSLYIHNQDGCYYASSTIAIGKINQRDVIGGVEECVCVCVNVWRGRVGCLCLTVVIISVFSCALGRIRSVSLQKSESFSGSHTQPGSESRRQYAANVRHLSPQLIKTKSSFDLSGLFWLPRPEVDLGLVPGAACVAGWREEKKVQKKGESGGCTKERMGRCLKGFME